MKLERFAFGKVLFLYLETSDEQITAKTTD